MGSVEKPETTDYDMIIVGAGISGINAAYRFQTETPNLSYTILEARGEMGGTWDLFRYPGIRSDSDLHTFGFAWRPWASERAIADAPSIRKYIKESAAEYGIDRNIRYHHKLIAADWSSSRQSWSLIVDADGIKKYYTARFVLFSTGYYDYDEPLEAKIPGIEDFKGTVVHPQFWPEDLDYVNKNVVVIGSGATAITLLPSLAQEAAHVTMLQRSPSYILAQPAVDRLGTLAHKWLPSSIAFKIVRWKFLLLPLLFFNFCRSFPNAARNLLRKATAQHLPKGTPIDPDFQPAYNPWDQRLCVCPDGDFYKSLSSGKTSIVTAHIDKVSADSITLKESGRTLKPDIIVTATGLKIRLVGGASVTVDGNRLMVNDKFFWKGLMLQDLPNAAVVIGYTNASWTLGADATAKTICRLIKYMDARGLGVATPRLGKEGKGMKATSVLDLNSTYVEKAKGVLPKAGDRGPWKARSNYFRDLWEANWGNLEKGMEFTPILET
jgi:cation diffusion facilitator CzcD-associated flavoprotein CzcO